MKVKPVEEHPGIQIEPGDFFLDKQQQEYYHLTKITDSFDYGLCSVSGTKNPYFEEGNLDDLRELIQDHVASGDLVHYSQTQWNLRLEPVKPDS